MLSPLYLILLVRPGGYTVNLCSFYFYKFIGKLTAFLQLQEFSLCNITVVSSTRRVDPSDLAFSLSSHRHSHISLLFSFHFID